MSVGVSNARIGVDGNDVQRVVDTACLGCVFAKGEYEGDEDGLTFIQDYYGCKLDVIRRLAQQGEEVHDAEDGKGNEFHVIRARVCPFYRTPQWKPSETDGENFKRVRKEVTLRPDVVVYLGPDHTLNDVLATANALKSGTIEPRRLYIINNNEEIRPSHIMKAMRQCPLSWRAETVLEGPCSVQRAMDIITKKCDQRFVLYFEAGFKPSNHFIECMDKALHDELDKFLVLTPYDYEYVEDRDPEAPLNINGLAVLRVFHKQAGGNARAFIADKSTRLCEEQKCQYLTRPVTQIVTQ